MKTLVLNGSPRKNGDTVTLINEMTKYLSGDVKVISSYYDNITPCLDCRYCWSSSGCCIDDRMQDVYGYIEECDNIILASPIYFSELTGSLLGLLSRVQTYFASKYFRGEDIDLKNKNGALILVGAQKGTEEKASRTAYTVFRHLNVYPCVASVLSMNTNNTAAVDDDAALKQAKEAAKLLNGLCEDSAQ